jgi:hypothetical protein
MKRGMVMAHLGKCMLFYLKYTAEMERLYESEKPKVEGLPNPDQVLKKNQPSRRHSETRSGRVPRNLCARDR